MKVFPTFLLFLSSVFLLLNCGTTVRTANSLELKADQRSPSSEYSPHCSPLCTSSKVCMNTEVGKPSSCLDGFDLLLQPIFALPFDSNTEVVCTHSKGVGSHSYPNTFYSLDIGTDYTKNSPPGTVIASADGTAYVFLGENGNPCPLPNGTPTNADSSDCGNGWGNHIKILHENGYFSFYVHLEKVLIKTGDIIKKGQPIGIEGYTGSAGHRHLHWSIQKLPGLPEEWATQILTYSGNSVPFQFKANVDGTTQILSSDSFHCPHAGIGNSNSPQPRLTGTLD